MNELIAVVATAVIVNGERVVIDPGRTIPNLTEHDAVALKGSGAALDPELDAEAREKVEAAALAAAAEFQAQRARVKAEVASIAVEKKPDADAQVDQVPPPVDPVSPADQTPPPADPVPPDDAPKSGKKQR